MDAFHETSFPLTIAFGAKAGPERRTEIVTLGSGREERNTPWAHGRRRYDLAGAVRSLDDLHAVIAFFEARRGRLHGFRFRDFTDWRSGPPSRAPGPQDQALGVGNGVATSFALKKTYESGLYEYARAIQKPVEGSLRVAVGGVELAAGAFSVDPAEGLVRLTAAPASGAAVTAGFAFDTPVRFDTDHIEATLEAFGAGKVASIPLIEIKL